MSSANSTQCPVSAVLAMRNNRCKQWSQHPLVLLALNRQRAVCPARNDVTARAQNIVWTETSSANEQSFETLWNEGRCKISNWFFKTPLQWSKGKTHYHPPGIFFFCVSRVPGVRFSFLIRVYFVWYESTTDFTSDMSPARNYARSSHVVNVFWTWKSRYKQNIVSFYSQQMSSFACHQVALLRNTEVWSIV